MKFVFLSFLLFFIFCKDSIFFGKDYKVSEKNAEVIDLTFFCDPSGKRRYVSYFSKKTKVPLEELKTVFYCDRYVSNSIMYQLGIISQKSNNNVVIVIGEFSCKNDICMLLEKPREHVDNEPDGKLVFKVINNDVIKLVSSNIKEMAFQDNENYSISYKDAEPFFSSDEEHYFYRERENLITDCLLEQIRVDIVGEKGVYCLDKIKK
ncbi:hypothetical protein [Leptospira idonii]|uniref:Uncharacterized protein n=1 Tax=Leptospira idonii TaxID=1193500 RepID=A0A4R9LYF4_9LEPT|nr:hypothetical protein [Leptospira idonii]TGN16870.1 hypothetical protein EHS15_18980 [Leptospira idonii]